MLQSPLSSTRRLLLTSSVAGAAALALRSAAAHDGTPAADTDTTLLFVQSAGNGVLTPSDQGYTLSFEHGVGQTIYFSDRPERLTGLLPTAELVAQWPFDSDSPPNAALAISNADDTEPQVFVGVLTNPEWNAASATLSYGFRMLGDDTPAGSPTPIPDAFANATLFIDGSQNLGGYSYFSNYTNTPIRVQITRP